MLTLFTCTTYTQCIASYLYSAGILTSEVKLGRPKHPELDYDYSARLCTAKVLL